MDRGRISLVMPASDRASFFGNQAPIGMLHAAALLRARSVDVRFHDFRVDGPDCARYADEFSHADLIVVATNDFDKAQCYNLKLDAVAATVSAIKRLSDRPVYCVGSHGTVAAEETRVRIGCDGVIRGEHDVAIDGFVEHFFSDRVADRIWPAHAPRLASAIETETLPPPAYELAPMHAYHAEGIDRDTGALGVFKSGLVLGNRGCPYSCSYCFLLFGQRVRVRPAHRIADEVEVQCREYGIEHFFFLDYTFTLNPRWVRSLCDELIHRDLPVSWLCQTRSDRLDEETLAAMFRAGCRGIWLGVETPEKTTRDQVEKNLSDEDVTRSLDMVREAGMHPLVFLMVGFPTETVESLQWINRWLEHHDVFYEIFTMIPRVGTALFDESRFRQMFERDGWDYALALPDQRVGARTGAQDRLSLSPVSIDEIDWFVSYHEQNPKRVRNVVAQALDRV
jgi:radical SAM superfamily enzyme YgiQ (UPF0313 family)